MITNDYTQLHQYVGTQIFNWSTAGFTPRRPKRSKEKTWLAQQAENERFARLIRDDNDLLEIISVMITRGMLN